MNAADDVDTIASRLKEIEEEKRRLLSQPLEDEPGTIASTVQDPFWGCLEKQPDGTWKIASYICGDA